MQISNIPIDEIFSDGDFNCRGQIVPFDVIELMNSIKANGLQQPIVVEPFVDGNHKYRIIMGHRRYSACKLAGLQTIHAIVRENLSRLQALTMNLIENLERKNLTIMQEAKTISKFAAVNLSANQIAKMIGKPYGWVQLRVMALRLPPEIQAEVDAGFIATEDIRELYFLGNKDKQFEAVRQIKDRKLRGEKGRLKIRQRKQRVLDPFSRGPQTISQMMKMMDILIDAVGAGLHTRVLAWAAGEIATVELYNDIEEEAKKQGKRFIRPTQYVKETNVEDCTVQETSSISETADQGV